MKKLITIIIFGVLFSVSAMADQVRSHIDEMSAKFVSAFNDKDGAALASLYSEDGTLFPPGADRVDGRAAIQEFWQGVMDSGVTVDLRTVEVIGQGDIVSEIGLATLNVPGDEGSTMVNAPYIVVWKRAGHTWQLHRDIWNTK